MCKTDLLLGQIKCGTIYGILIMEIVRIGKCDLFFHPATGMPMVFDSAPPF